MPKEIVVVDYDIGNVFSVCNAIAAVGASPILTGDRKKIAAAERLILPGVGAFGRAMEELGCRGLEAPIREFIATGRPFLGVCVGMQMLMDESTEFGINRGLGLIGGRVERIPAIDPKGRPHPVPHISWGALNVVNGNQNWAGTPLGALESGRSSFYFVHSYMCVPADPAALLATVDYNGQALTAAIRKDNVVGVQFHPERSGIAGHKLLKAFVSL